MKSSTARKTKKTETPRLITDRELEKLTLEVYLYPEGWVVVDHNYDIKSVHRTQTEAINNGRVLARKRAGQLIIHDRKGLARNWEHHWSGPVRFERSKPEPPSSPPINATKKAIREAMKEAMRTVNAEAAQQQNK